MLDVDGASSATGGSQTTLKTSLFVTMGHRLTFGNNLFMISRTQHATANAWNVTKIPDFALQDVSIIFYSLLSLINLSIVKRSN